MSKDNYMPCECQSMTKRTLFLLGYYAEELGITRPAIFCQPRMTEPCYLRYFEGMQREYNPFEYDMPFNWITGWYVQV